MWNSQIYVGEELPCYVSLLLSFVEFYEHALPISTIVENYHSTRLENKQKFYIYIYTIRILRTYVYFDICRIFRMNVILDEQSLIESTNRNYSNIKSWFIDLKQIFLFILLFRFIPKMNQFFLLFTMLFFTWEET